MSLRSGKTRRIELPPDKNMRVEQDGHRSAVLPEVRLAEAHNIASDLPDSLPAIPGRLPRIRYRRYPGDRPAMPGDDEHDAFRRYLIQNAQTLCLEIADSELKFCHSHILSN